MKLSNTAGNTELFSLLIDSNNKQGTSELINNTPAIKQNINGDKDIDLQKKVLINFKVSKKLKQDFTTLCNEKEITLTAGIKLAIKKIIENGGF